MISNHWHNKQILVTGAGGFIGSHLVEALVRNDAQVRAFVRYNSRGDPGLLSMIDPEIYENLKIIAGDLRDLPALIHAMHNVDYVFHLGALIEIPYSYQHPFEVVDTNVMGTLNVLLAGHETGVKRIIHTSTSEVYGTALWTPIAETHPLQGQSPYSASKIGADKLAESFYRAYDLPVVIIRPFNTYGPRQSTRAVIPTIINQALTQDIVYLGNLEAYRDFTYVSDTVEGFLCAAQVPGIEGETFNLGFGSEIQIKALVEEVVAIIGKPVDIQVEATRLRPVKSEVQRLISDNSFARERLGWTPKITLHEGLIKTIEWTRENLHAYNAHQYQI